MVLVPVQCVFLTPIDFIFKCKSENGKHIMNVNAFKVCLHFANFKVYIIFECNINTSSFRCIAVCSLGLWVCEELMQKNIHQQVKDAISVLGVTLKVSNSLRK